MFDCRIRNKKYPEEDEIVMTRISAINDDVVTVKLIEYGDIEGLVMSGEISKKKYKNVQQVVKVGNMELCMVLKVDENKGFIDLSLKRIGEKERTEGRERFGKEKMAYQIMCKTAKMVEKTVKEMYEMVGYRKEEEYGGLFVFFMRAKDNPGILGEGEVAEALKKVIDEQLRTASYKVRADVDVSTATGGIALIKDAFMKAVAADPSLEISLIRSPTYSIQKISESKEEAFEGIARACEIIKAGIGEDGTFSISNPAKVYGDKTKFELSEENEEESK